MKANELRIGNWVTFMGDIIEVTPEIIVDCDIDNKKPSPICYKGIPITPEVLEKCGFNSGHSNYYFKNGIEVNIKDEELDGIGNIPLQYLHQLQNLYFALTGTELEYKP